MLSQQLPPNDVSSTTLHGVTMAETPSRRNVNCRPLKVVFEILPAKDPFEATSRELGVMRGWCFFKTNLAGAIIGLSGGASGKCSQGVVVRYSCLKDIIFMFF